MGGGGGGATAEDVALMRAVVGDDVGVKASGGVRTIDDVEAMVAAGANRVGASSSVPTRVPGGTAPVASAARYSAAQPSPLAACSSRRWR